MGGPKVRPENWKKLERHWELCLDLAGEGLSDPEIKRKYLRPQPQEPAEAYSRRLWLADPVNPYADAISDTAALLSQFALDEEVPESFVENQDDIDLEGSSFKAFDTKLTELALACDAVMVLVDYSSEAVRPYLVLMPISSCYAPLSEMRMGRKTIDRIGLADCKMQAKSGEEFETEKIDQLRLYTTDPAQMQLWEAPAGDDLAMVGDPVEFRRGTAGRGSEPMESLPIAWLSLSGAPVLEPNLPPMIQLATLTCVIFNKQSIMDASETICLIPTPFIQYPGTGPATPQDFVVGSNYCAHLELGAQAGFLQANPAALQLARETQAERMMRAKELGRAFVETGKSGTLGEAVLKTTQSKLSIQSMANFKVSFWQEIFKYWALLDDRAFNPESDSAGSIIFDESALSAQPNQSELNLHLQNWQGGFTTSEEYARIQGRLGLLTEEEVAQIVDRVQNTPTFALNDNNNEVLG